MKGSGGGIEDGAGDALLVVLSSYGYIPLPPEPGAGMGQSSSVMLDQKIQTMIIDSNVNNISKREPLILPFVPEQMYLLTTYWKICPRANSIAALKRYTASLLVDTRSNDV